MANLFRANKKGGGGGLTVDSLVVTQMPNKTRYLIGENLDFTGIKVEATAGHLNGDVENYATYNPVEGTEVTTVGTHVVNVSYLGASTNFNVIGAIRQLLKKTPYDFSNGSVVVLNNEIHILGGNNNSTKHYKWDGSNWVSVSTLPYSYTAGDAVVYNDEIHIFGSKSGNTNHYKWDGSNWVSVSTLPYADKLGAAVVLNDEIHLLGLYISGSDSYTKHYKWDGSSWVSVSTMPYSFFYGGAVVYNDEIHIFGGNNSNTYWRRHYKWDGSNWVSVSTLPFDFADYSSAVVYNNEIHILSDYISPDGGHKHYKWDGSNWVSVSTLPYFFNRRKQAVVWNSGASDEIAILGSNLTDYTNYAAQWDGTEWTVATE